MIGSVSNYSSYTSTSTSTSATNSARSQQFQKELLAKLDSNSDGSVDQDELSSALSQKSDDGILVSLSKNFSDLDSDSSGGVSSDELKAALQAGRSENSDSSDQASVADALNKMIANLSKQYQLDNVATVGKHLNVAT